MKKVFALLLVFVMLLSAAPVLAEETPQIESVVLSNDDFGRRVSINLQNLPRILTSITTIHYHTLKCMDILLTKSDR